MRLGYDLERTLRILNAERITADIARARELKEQRKRDHIMLFDAGYIASDADLAQQQAAAAAPYAGEEPEPTQEELDQMYQDLKEGKIFVPDPEGNPTKLKFPEDEEEPELDPAAPHGGSDIKDGGSDEPVRDPIRWTKTEPEHNTPAVQELNAVLAELGLPGFFDQCDALSRGSFMWVLDGAWRYVKNTKARIIEDLRNGTLTAERTQFKCCGTTRLQLLPEEPAADADLDDYERKELEQAYRALKRKHDATPEPSQEAKEQVIDDPLSPRIKKPEVPKEEPRDVLIRNLRAQLEESEQMRQSTVAAKDKLILRNRELEAENESLKTQLAELRAKLEQYEGMGA